MYINSTNSTNTLLKELIAKGQEPEYIYAGEKMDSVMAKFDRTGAWRLPVIDEDRKYLGFISKSRLLMAYRAELKEIASED